MFAKNNEVLNIILGSCKLRNNMETRVFFVTLLLNGRKEVIKYQIKSFEKLLIKGSNKL